MRIEFFFIFFLLIFTLGCKEENPSNDTDTSLTDKNACLEGNETWGKATDSWSTTGGQFSDDNATWIRSQIPYEQIPVTLYYQKTEAYSYNSDFIALGEYSVIGSEGEALRFDVMFNQAFLGTSPYFYIKVENTCYRADLPATPYEVVNPELAEVKEP